MFVLMSCPGPSHVPRPLGRRSVMSLTVLMSLCTSPHLGHSVTSLTVLMSLCTSPLGRSLTFLMSWNAGWTLGDVTDCPNVLMHTSLRTLADVPFNVLNAGWMLGDVTDCPNVLMHRSLNLNTRWRH
jgi:hypothetical protein